MAKPSIRITFNLSPDDYDKIVSIMAKTGKNQTDVLVTGIRSLFDENQRKSKKC